MNLLWWLASWFGGTPPDIADAYLDDFVKVDAVGRMVVVEDVGRVVVVPAVGRMVVVK